MKIKINISNMQDLINVYASDEEDKQLIVNGKTIETDVDEFITQVLFITNSWNPVYSGFGVDGESFNLLFENNGKKREINGKNSLPTNYHKLKNLVRRFLKWWNQQ